MKTRDPAVVVGAFFTDERKLVLIINGELAEFGYLSKVRRIIFGPFSWVLGTPVKPESLEIDYPGFMVRASVKVKDSVFPQDVIQWKMDPKLSTEVELELRDGGFVTIPFEHLSPIEAENLLARLDAAAENIDPPKSIGDKSSPSSAKAKVLPFARPV